jgi:hypothetical protein
LRLQETDKTYIIKLNNAQVKKKLTSAQKLIRKKAKEENQKKYMWVFLKGKHVKFKRPPMIEGIDAEEYIQHNADPIWLHQNGMWEHLKGEAEVYKTDVEDMDKL